MDWLIKSYALTILPSIYSLKTMRTQVATVEAKKPMIAFADPVFSKKAQDEAKAEQVAMRSLSSFYRGPQLDVRSLAESLPPAARNSHRGGDNREEPGRRRRRHQARAGRDRGRR